MGPPDWRTWDALLLVVVGGVEELTITVSEVTAVMGPPDWRTWWTRWRCHVTMGPEMAPMVPPPTIGWWWATPLLVHVACAHVARESGRSSLPAAETAGDSAKHVKLHRGGVLWRRRRRQAGSGPIGQWWRVPDGAQTGGSRQQTDGQEPAFIAVCSRLKSGRRTGADAERDATAGLRAGAEQDAAAGLRADAEQDADSRAACRHRQRGDGGMEDDADDNGQMDLTVIFCPLLSGSGAAGCGRARGGGAAGRRPAETAARSPVLLQLPPCPALQI